jgi:unsaturated chondroitin disaccharide hydrolase
LPNWDFRVEQLEDEPRDSSAAASTASGLVEIAKHVPQAEPRFYTDWWKKILKSLAENYASWDQPEHEAILEAERLEKQYFPGWIDSTIPR